MLPASDRQATTGGRALVAIGLLLVAVLVSLLLWSRVSKDDNRDHTGSPQAHKSSHRDPLARVVGGPQDPNVDDAERVLSLHVRVVDMQRRPVADAEVELLSRPAGVVRGDHKTSARTDASGELVIPQLRAGAYRVEARKDDAVSATVETQLTAQSKPVTLILVPAATMNVLVVSAADDRPIAGALVRVSPGNAELGSSDVSREARTDASGVARIAGLNPVSNHGVYAEAEGYAGSTTNVLAGGNPVRHGWSAVVKLKAGGVVTGRVIDKRGRPIAHAALRWYSGDAAKDADQAPGVFSSHQGVLRLGTVRSGADGGFRLAAPIGPGLVEAAHPSHRVGFARGTVVAGRELSLDVVVDDGAKLAGVVLDASGNPVPGAEVIATKPGLSHQQMFADIYRFRATTDRYGEFAFAGLDRDEVSLVAWNADGSSELVQVDLRQTPEQTGIVLELARTGRITGVVLDGDGTPAPYAQVTFFVVSHTVTPPAGVAPETFMPALIANPRSQGIVIADEDGRFTIGGLVDGEYQLTARRARALSVAPVFGEARLDKVRPGADVKLALPALGSISGRVDGAGAPLTGITVAAAGWQKGMSYPPGVAVSGDGTFVLTEVPAGRYGIKLEGANVIDWSSADGFDVVAGRTTDVGTIRITRGVPSRPGVVVDPSGTPVAATQVVMQIPVDGALRTVEDVSDEKGAFTVPAVPHGAAVRLRAYTPEVTSDWQVLGPDAPTVRVTLAAGGSGTLAGLVAQNGQSLDKRTVMLTLDSVVMQGTDANMLKSRADTVTDSGGSFRFKNVPVGQYRLWIRKAEGRGPEWSAHAEPIVIQPGKEVFVVVQLAP